MCFFFTYIHINQYIFIEYNRLHNRKFYKFTAYKEVPFYKFSLQSTRGLVTNSSFEWTSDNNWDATNLYSS